MCVCVCVCVYQAFPLSLKALQLHQEGLIC